MVGRRPPGWVDVADAGADPSWLYHGAWLVTASPTVALGPFVVRQERQLPQPALTFLRYDGAAFASVDGGLPAYYVVQTSVQPISSDYLPATGDLGVQVYYLDPLHYVEVLVKNDEYQVWLENGGLPLETTGWTLLWQEPLVTRAYDVRQLGAVVDTVHHIVWPTLDGQARAALYIPSVTTRPHWYALRAAGQVVNYGGVTLRVLPTAPPAPTRFDSYTPSPRSPSEEVLIVSIGLLASVPGALLLYFIAHAVRAPAWEVSS